MNCNNELKIILEQYQQYGTISITSNVKYIKIHLVKFDQKYIGKKLFSKLVSELIILSDKYNLPIILKVCNVWQPIETLDKIYQHLGFTKFGLIYAYIPKLYEYNYESDDKIYLITYSRSLSPIYDTLILFAKDDDNAKNKFIIKHPKYYISKVNCLTNFN